MCWTCLRVCDKPLPQVRRRLCRANGVVGVYLPLGSHLKRSWHIERNGCEIVFAAQEGVVGVCFTSRHPLKKISAVGSERLRDCLCRRTWSHQCLHGLSRGNLSLYTEMFACMQRNRVNWLNRNSTKRFSNVEVCDDNGPIMDAWGCISHSNMLPESCLQSFLSW